MLHLNIFIPTYQAQDSIVLDIGSIIGGQCIYSCVMEHSVCQIGKCSCLHRAVEVGGYCTVGKCRASLDTVP